jgi:ubiquinone/menaquinone biosynthesis C-methylase UbiE
MLAIAKEKLSHLSIDWQIINMNAEQLPFDDNSIDLVVCCFGFMFVEDKPGAYAEIRRVLRPGGSLVLSTWSKLEENAASHVFRKTVKQFLGDSLPETYRLPFSMPDPEEIKQALLLAGFSKATSEISMKSSVCASAKEAAFGLMHGGSLYEEIKNRNPMWLDQIPAIVEKELAEAYGIAPMRAPMKAVISQAWK